MTSRERLLCVLQGKNPDRIPVSPFVQEEYLSYYYNKPETNRLYDAVALCKELHFDLMTRQNISSHAYFAQKSYPNWDVRKDTKIADGKIVVTTVITTPEKNLTQREGAAYNEKMTCGIHMSTLEYLIKDVEDFAVFKKYCPEMNHQDIDFILNSGAEARTVIGDLGINCPWSLGGVYNLVSTYMDVQDMMMDALSDEEYYDEYMSYFTEMVRKNYAVFAQSAYDAVGVQGNIANGALMGEAFFRQHVLPYESHALAVLRQANKPTVYHNCGNAKNLYPCYRELGITVWETVAPPPMGDNRLQQAKEYFGSSLVLSGNFDQVHFLKAATPQEIEQAAGEQMQIGKQGGSYIFACSDYLEYGTPLENVKALLKGASAVADCNKL